MNLFSAIVSIAVLATSLSGGHGCSCDFGDVPQTINNYLHSSSTAIRVKLAEDVTPQPDVSNTTDTPVDLFIPYNFYKAEVLYAVKGNVTKGSIIIVKDASDSGRCGLPLEAGQTWLLAGTIGKSEVGDYTTDVPMFFPSPCKSHNRRWAHTNAWERKLVNEYRSDKGLCYKKDCMGVIGAPMACPDGVSSSSTKKLCEFKGDRCGYSATVTPCPAVNCTSNQDCLNDWHCAINGLCDFGGIV